MKKNRILGYTILSLSSFFFSSPLTAQENKKITIIEEAPIPLYQGTYIGVDVFGLGSKFLGSSTTSSEVSIEVNLKNRFIPTVEIGYSETDATNDETNIHYKTAAPYFRIGMNYNALFKKTHLPGYLFAGVRYAFTSFSYDVEAPPLVDPTWGNITIPFIYEGVKTNVGWFELIGGVKTKVYKSFYMGWTLRFKARMSMTKKENTEPLYIPGFGKNGSTQWGVTYSLIYKLPL